MNASKLKKIADLSPFNNEETLLFNYLTRQAENGKYEVVLSFEDIPVKEATIKRLRHKGFKIAPRLCLQGLNVFGYKISWKGAV